MMQLTIRPLEKWPRQETRDRRNDQYKASYDRTLHDLEYEAQRLDVTDGVLIQLDVIESQISIHGALKNGASPRTLKVKVSMDAGTKGTVFFCCDCFTDWRANLRAIVLGMNHLRMVEKTGIVSAGEQYTGFRALPPGIPMPAPKMTVEEAVGVVIKLAESPVLLNTDQFRAKLKAIMVGEGGQYVFDNHYRAAVKTFHPDRGGNPTKWQELQDAKKVWNDAFPGGKR